MAGSRNCDLKINFDSNITSVTIMGTSVGLDSPVIWTSSGQTKSYEFNAGQTYNATVSLVSGYKLSKVTATDSKISIGSITDNSFTVTITLAADLYELTLISKSTAIKIVNSDNLARFKQKCDETYAPIGSGGGTISGYTVTVEQDSLAGVSSPSIVFEKADGTTQTVTSSASSTTVNNVVRIWATIGMDGNLFGVSRGINVLATFIDSSDKEILVYSVSMDGEIQGGGGVG